MEPRSSGVFSDAERQGLIARELPLGDPLEQRTMEERYLAYSAACAPAERLYVGWPRSADGEDKAPSELVRALLAIFPACGPCTTCLGSTLPIPRRRPSPGWRPALLPAIARPRPAPVFCGGTCLPGRVQALERASGQRQQRVEDPALARGLFGERLFLSPTQVEAYHQCRFQYFCRYGLDAKERRHAEVDVLQYGTLMHYLFERIFRLPAEERRQWTEEELLSRVQGLIEAYAQENMGGMELLSGREKYRLWRLAQSACRLIRHVEEELAQSRRCRERLEWGLGLGGIRRPCGFTPDGALSQWAAPSTGWTCTRVAGGCRCVRVIDYKTGQAHPSGWRMCCGAEHADAGVLGGSGGERRETAGRGALHARGRALGLGGPGCGPASI